MGRQATANNNLALNFPEIASEWHPTKNQPRRPEEFLPKSNKKFWWLCSSCSHEWYLAIADRHGYRCPSCAGKVVHSDGHNSLAVMNPEIASEWHESLNGDLLPSMILPSSGKMAYWRCGECKHVWNTTPNHRCDSKGNSRIGGGCPCCAGQAVNSENAFNSLESRVPWILEEWDYDSNEILPREILPRSHHNVHWICRSCNDTWPAKPADRVNADFSPRNGCPTCSNFKVHRDGRNSLATKEPKIASEWHPMKNGLIEPTDIVSGTHTKYWWKCDECEYEWKISPGSRTQGLRTGCPACQNLAIKPDKSNTLANFAPWSKNEWHYEKNGEMTPESLVFGARKKVWWKCSTCDYEYRAMIYSKVDKDGSRLRGCAACSNKIVHPDGRNSLLALRPDIADEWHEDNPDGPHELTFGSNQSRKWICKEGHTWKASVNTRLRSGCRICAKYGWNPSYPGSLYVLEINTDEEGIFYKAGITNQRAEERMKKITRTVKKMYSGASVKLVTDHRFTLGKFAEEIESIIMMGPNRFQPEQKIDGYTECFSVNPIDKINSIIEKENLIQHLVN
jgi:DNA-directed RNA polymerase subunit RPC12/RpoP